MKRYIAYLKYVLRHKWYVAHECFREGIYWRAFVHDMSKFLPSEFIPYAKHFYNSDGSLTVIRNETGYYKLTDTGDAKFDFAWLLHQKRNRHHWQWWMLPEDDGGIKVLEIDKNDVKEMICDWVGAGKAQGYVSPRDDRYFETRAWYIKNKDKMVLGTDTRRYIENIIFHCHKIDLEDK